MINEIFTFRSYLSPNLRILEVIIMFLLPPILFKYDYFQYFSKPSRYYKNCCPGSAWNSETQQCQRKYTYYVTDLMFSPFLLFITIFFFWIKLTVKVHATVAETFVMFPQDIQIFLQVNKFSPSRRYDKEQLFFLTLH